MYDDNFCVPYSTKLQTNNRYFMISYVSIDDEYIKIYDKRQF